MTYFDDYKTNKYLLNIYDSEVSTLLQGSQVGLRTLSREIVKQRRLNILSRTRFI